MPPQNYMLNASMDAKFLASCMSFYSGQTKCPHMWTFVFSVVNLIKMYYFIYVNVSYQHYKFTMK